MSTVLVQVGQCGNQVGTKFFDLIIKDASIPTQFSSPNTTENICYNEKVVETYFNETMSGDIYANAVMIDMERKALAKCQDIAHKSGIWKYSEESVFSARKGSGNNWSLGYHKHGETYEDDVINICRKQIERCDRFTGFLVLMSLAGGTGSGFGTRLTYSLRDNFPNAVLINHLIWPYISGEVVLQNYNVILTLSHLQQCSDLLLSQRNDQAHEICSKLLSIKEVSFDDINDVISHKLASVLQPIYSVNYRSVDPFHCLVQGVGSHPSYKLASIKNVPHISERSMAYTTYHWPAILKHLRQMLIADSSMDEGVNWEIKLPISSNEWRKSTPTTYSIERTKFNKSLSNLLILRGKDIHEADTKPFTIKELYSPVMTPEFTFTEYHQSRPFNNYQKSATLVSNSQSFICPLNSCVEKAWKMFQERAFVHQYEKCGLSEGDFIDSFGVVEQMISRYSSI